MNLSKIMDSQISREQMMADYKAIDGMNLAEKKEKAAEYSDKVTPHFRFIITDKK